MKSHLRYDNLLKAQHRLLARHPELQAHVAADKPLTWQQWQALWVQPAYTLSAAGCLRGCLLHVAGSAVEACIQTQPPDAGQYQQAALALMRVLELHSSISRLLLRLLHAGGQPLQLLADAAAGSAGQPPAGATTAAELLAVACLNTYQHATQLAASWPAGPLFGLLSAQQPLVRWCAAQMLAQVLQLSDAVKEQLIMQRLSIEEVAHAQQRWEAEQAAVKLEIAAWWMDTSSATPAPGEADTAGAAAAPQSTTTGSSRKSKKAKRQAQEAAGAVAGEAAVLPDPPGFVSVQGIEVACTPAPQLNAASSSGGRHLVQTPAVQQALADVALTLSQGRPVLLEGPAGCGKTALLEELAGVTGRADSVVWLHLDDQMDAKSLLGSYTCTAVPGEFVWQPGPLARAVTEGRWVVIEAVDAAPADVLAALVPLLDSRVLHVPSRAQVLAAAPGFQLFGTVTTTAPSSSAALEAAEDGAGRVQLALPSTSPVQELLGGLWARVQLPAPTATDQLQILTAAFPVLRPLLMPAMASMHLMQLAAGREQPPAGLRPAAATVSPAEAAVSWAVSALAAARLRPGDLALNIQRAFGLRDLLKWCGRMQRLHGSLLQRSFGSSSAGGDASTAGADLVRLDLQLRVVAFREAADVWTGGLADHDRRQHLLTALTHCWSVPEQVVSQYQDLQKPHVAVQGQDVQVGRVHLPRPDGAAAPGASQGLGRFTHTAHALRVMECVAAALHQQEPVLLVGETGTGKTTTLSHLADLVGAKVVAFNLSQQTDSSDLLGGFRPVGAQEALLPLLTPFQQLIRATWTKGNNEDFLSRVTKYAERRKWQHLLSAYKAAVAKVGLQEPSAGAGEDAGAAATAADSGADPQQQQQLLQERQNSHQGTSTSTAEAAAAGGGGRGKGKAARGRADRAGTGAPIKKRRTGSTGGAAEVTENNPAAAQAAADGKSAAPGAASVAGGSASDKARKGAAVVLPPQLAAQWQRFQQELAAAERAAGASEAGFAFSFVEGQLVKALREGWWLLLDELNLAPPEVLERIAGILEAPPATDAAASSSSHQGLLLVERGDAAVIQRHPNFRLVAAMNPATDAGKRELPATLRSRFTELWVAEPRQREDLVLVVAGYLQGAGPHLPVDGVVDLYLAAKQAADKVLTDGAGQRPAYSLRTLCRALDYARRAAPLYGLQRSLYDGFAMSFLTQLSPEAAPKMEALLQQHLLPGVKNMKAVLRTPPAPPGNTHVLFEHFWLERGPEPLPELGEQDDGSQRRFVVTPSVCRQLSHLARAVLLRKHPILLQGPTSSGKTSLVAYLAAQTGHKFVRINNHQHTDLQEYLGSWVSDDTGRLVFKEGALVTALRQGHWVVLDELNLAPSEVLEALNRLLDDNRELLVPELQEVVRPHPHFMLFATQNPPGTYAGRKPLSRAFRGRFLELHVEELPDAELQDILAQRCGIAPSYAAKMVGVMRELQRRRHASNVFAGKQGFITPRDLFRWAERGAVGYQQLAEEGFMLLGERLRAPEERAVVASVLEQQLKVKLDMEEVYRREASRPQQRLQEALAAAEQAAAQADALAAAASADAGNQQARAQAAASLAAALAAAAEAEAIRRALSSIVWTRSLQRLYVLVDRCLTHQEPVLLVGETGVGKTSVCQLLALMRRQRLHILNCNQHTETSDFLGGFRPSRHREQDAADFRAAAQQVLASPLWAATASPAPQLPPTSSPQELATAVPILSAAARKLLTSLTSHTSLPPTPEAQQQQVALQEAVERMEAAGAAARAPFMWVDGPLVVAMRGGDLLLVDEVNLAEDAVLERLNSVLEPGRTLTLAERGGEGAEVIVGAEGFRVLATMNPGGDFGKKELSPALSNRFTQVWVPVLDDPQELTAILTSRLAPEAAAAGIAPLLMAFWSHFQAAAPVSVRGALSVRDLLAWVTFINTTVAALGPLAAYVHGAYLTLLDGLGLGSGLAAAAVVPLKASCQQLLLQQVPADMASLVAQAAGSLPSLVGSSSKEVPETAMAAADSAPDGCWGMAPFFIPCGSHGGSTGRFELAAPTTARNAFRLLRAMQLRKAVLLEGSPGVGKTSLVSALARAAGVTLVRVNLSEHTDMLDLLGADLPAAGGGRAQFTWCDGPLLRALKQGYWVLLDELNLAGQSILEGLNALLDHREQVFVPELGQTFDCHPQFRLFAAQNPLQEGGGRKGLPKSFLNRFTRVAVELLQPQDLLVIASALHPELPLELLQRMVLLLGALQQASSPGAAAAAVDTAWMGPVEPAVAGRVSQAVAAVKDAAAGAFAAAGGPWEFNLRDLLRWCELAAGCCGRQGPAGAHAPTHQQLLQQQQLPGMSEDSPPSSSRTMDWEAAVEHFVPLLLMSRLRTPADRRLLAQLFEAVWGRAIHAGSSLMQTPDPATGAAAADGDTAAPDSVWGVVQDLAQVVLTPATAVIGAAHLPRAAASSTAASAMLQPPVKAADLELLPWQAPMLEAAAHCLGQGWMCLLVGGAGTGKTSLARLLAQLAGVQLTELAMTSGTDTSDLLGSFEQVEPARKLQDLAGQVQGLLQQVVASLLTSPGVLAGQPGGASLAGQQLHQAWSAYEAARAAAADADPQQVAQLLLPLCKVAAMLLQLLQALPPSSPNQQPSPAALPPAAAAQQVVAAIDGLHAELTVPGGQATAGRFEWVDGTLTRAIQHGGWVLLDNANLCNPTVLDRLNGLLEPGGVLQLDEAGSSDVAAAPDTAMGDAAVAAGAQPGQGVRVLAPHPGFRLLLAMDPRHGEVSRAMRNRGMELCLLPPAMLAQQESLVQGGQCQQAPLSAPTWPPPPGSTADLQATLAAAGITGQHLVAAMASAAAAASAACSKAHRRPPGLREAKDWATTALTLLQRSCTPAEATWAGWQLSYLHTVATTPALAAECCLAYLQLCWTLGWQPCRAAAAACAQVLGPMRQLPWVQQLLAAAPVVGTGTHPAPAEGVMEVDSSGAAAEEEEPGQQLARLQHSSSVQVQQWPGDLLQPCAWPQRYSLTWLAQQSSWGQVVRDAGLPGWLLLQGCTALLQAHPEAAAAAAHQAAQQGWAAGQLAALPTRLLQQVLLGSGPAGQGQQLSGGSCHLPRLTLVAAALASCRPALASAAASGASDSSSTGSALSQEQQQQMLRAAWQALGSNSAVGLLQHLAKEPAGKAVSSSTSLVAPASALLAAVTQVLQEGSGHSVLQQLQPVLTACCGWAPAAAAVRPVALQLLSSIQSSLLRGACMTAAQTATQQRVRQGSATLYQQSWWRAGQPGERARTTAAHPVVDLLPQLLSAANTAEQLALQQVAGGLVAAAAAATTPAGMSEQVAAVQRLVMQLQRLQRAVDRVFELVHAPVQLQFNLTGASADTAAAAASQQQNAQEHLPWCWLQLRKHLQLLLEELPGSPELTQLSVSWQYLSQQVAEALQLTQHVDKPLLWKHGGHPQLPSSRQLLLAQGQGAAVAAALAPVARGKPFAVDGRGQAEALAAAGVDVAQLIADALQPDSSSAGEEGQMEADVPQVGPEEREQLAAAVAAGVACCPALHQACVQGLALLQAASQPATSAPAASTGEGSASQQPTATEAAQVPTLLQQQVASRAQQLTVAAVRQLRNQQQQPTAGAIAATLHCGLLLPGAAMASGSCRTLQLGLLQLYGTTQLQLDCSLLTQLLGWAMAAASGSAVAVPAELQQRLQQLVEVSSAMCVRSPEGLSAHQQLLWVLGSLTAAAGSSEAVLVQQQWLPSLLHAAWYAWNAAAWSSGSSLAALADGSSRSSGAAQPQPVSAGLQAVWELLQGPVQLHLAAQTAAVQQLLRFGSGDVTSQRPRVQQLRLTLQHLLSAGAASSSRNPVQGWVMMGQQLAVVLLAHSSSLPDPASRLQLQQIVQQLLLTDPVQPAAADTQKQLLQQLDMMLRSSSHGLLRSLAPLLLLCASDVAAVLQHAGGASNSAGSSSWQQQLAHQGRSWVRLGAARLLLCVPPAGVDPAGKAGLAAAATISWLQQLDAELKVRSFYQALPGGPSEGPAMALLLQQRREALQRLEQLSRSNVARPAVSQYQSLQQEAARFAAGVARPEQLSALGEALVAAAAPGADPAAASAALQQAATWSSSANAWYEAMQGRYAAYRDVLQPLMLGVQEVKHGLALLQAAVAATHPGGSLGAAGAAAQHAAPQQQQQQLMRQTVGLLSYPVPLQQSVQLLVEVQQGHEHSTAAAILPAPASHLADAASQSLVCDQQLRQQQAAPGTPGVSRADLVTFQVTLKACRVALHAAVQEVALAGPAALAAGPSAATTSSSSSSNGSAALSRALQLFAQLWGLWQQVKAAEAQAAEEAAQTTKTKTRTFLTEEEEAEVEYQQQFPDHFAAFADLAGDDLEEAEGDHPAGQQQQQPSDAMEVDAAGSSTGEAATAAQAKSAAAKGLLSGELRQDIVALHRQLFAALAALQQRQPGSTVPPAAEGSSSSSSAAGGAAEAGQPGDPLAALSYQLGSTLWAAQQGLLPAELDGATRAGHVMQLLQEHAKINKAPAATAAASAAEAMGAVSTSAAAAAAAAKLQLQRTGPAAASLDLQQAVPEEAALMQAPVAAVAARLQQLLGEWPEHPVLLQLSAICARLLKLPVTSPLKQCLTGLELLLFRAQLWEDTAAKHVTMNKQMAAVAGLATRWRKLELASWRGLLQQVVSEHAGAAAAHWFHLYGLLVLQSPSDLAAAADAEQAQEGAGGGNSRQQVEEEVGYRRLVSLLEAFVQTTTVGEFAARLQLLQSFAFQLQVLPCHNSGSSSAVVAAVHNMLAYYSQFAPAVSAALESGLAPLSKELQDFVSLAKWEDRGYYALKISTERSQRQLHRLSRRVKQVLQQPSAEVLAAAGQAMGLGQLGVAAAPIHPSSAPPAAAPAAAGNEATAGAAAAPAALPPVAVGDPSLLGELSAEELAAWHSSSSTLGAAPGSSAAATAAKAIIKGTSNRSRRLRRGGRLGKRQQQGPQDVGQLPLEDALEAVAGEQTACWKRYSKALLAEGVVQAGQPGASADVLQLGRYSQRLGQLPAKLAKVLQPRPSLLQPPAAAATGLTMNGHPSAVEVAEGDNTPAAADADADGDLLQELSQLPPEVQLDELAATAAARALALRGDITKGARARKKKALTDFLGALKQVGYSQRSTDVALGDRDVAAWFKHPRPQLGSSSLLQPLTHVAAASSSSTGGVAAVGQLQLALGLCCWSKADASYYKALACWQQLEVAATAPSKDLAAQEVGRVVRYCRHQLYVLRQQRDLLGDTAAGYSQLQQVCGWLQRLANTTTTSSSTVQGAAGGQVNGAAPAAAAGDRLVLPQQQQVREWLLEVKASLDGLVHLLAGQQQLLEGLQPLPLAAAWQQQLTAAATAVAGARQRLTASKSNIDREVDLLLLAGRPLVDRSTVQVLQQAAEALQQSCAELAAAYPASAARSQTSSLTDLVIPGWEQLQAAMQHTAGQSAASLQRMQQQPVQVSGGSSSSSQHTNQLGTAASSFSSSLEQLVEAVLIWSQHQAAAPAKGADGTGAPGTAAAAADEGVVQWTAAAAAALRPGKLQEAAQAATAALGALAAASELAHAGDSSATGCVTAMQQQLAAVVPLLQLLLGGVQRRAVEVVCLHKSSAKLAYICTSLFCTLVKEGFCMPEGVEVEGGGDGEGGEWKEAGGTGMGDGTGQKDVSDQIKDEDQLLGAQQKGQQQEEQEAERDLGEEEAQGVEMEADFEGQMHDVDKQQQEEDYEGPSEEGEQDRLEQQMGEVGDNEELVDEKLWDGDDGPEEDQQQEQGQQEGVDRDHKLQVDDKSGLEYDGGGEDEQEGQDDPSKKQEQARKDAGPQQQEEASEEEGEGPDADDQYQQQQQGQQGVAPEAPDQELELPEDLNLDGAEDQEQEQEQQPMEEDAAQEEAGEQQQQFPEQPAGEEEGQQEQQGEEAPGGLDSTPGEQQQEPAAEEEEPPPGTAQQAPDAAAEQQEEEEEEGGEELDPAAAHGAPDEEQEQQQQLPDAGPRGLASTAAAPVPQPAGGADQQQQQQGEEQQPMEGVEEQQGGATGEPEQQQGPPQSQAGSVAADSRGRQAPAAPLQQHQQAAPQQPDSERRQQQQAAPDPLRSLGDALERWRADLALSQQALQQEDQAAAAAGQEEPEQQGEPDAAPPAPEYAFLGADQQQRQGDLQALAPATEEQAEQQPEAAALNQQQDQEEGEGQQEGEEGPTAMEEDTGDAGGDQEQQQQAAGAAPQTWAGSQRRTQMQQDAAAAEDGSGSEGEGEQQQEPTAEEEGAEGAQQQDAATGELPVSVVAAQLAASRLEAAEQQEEADEHLDARSNQLLGQLDPEDAVALRQQLDQRLREAAAAGASAAVATGPDAESALRYGRDMWARCEALVAGLAGELTEQLRLILEPSLASRLAGEYRSGKRLNMKKVIGYIASHFRRDKIWMRRSRPDKRKYQVVVAIDDSQSMAANGCGVFALEATALLCKAMSRLEVGELGVVSFGGAGGGVMPLQPLGVPFSDAAGPGLMAALRFDQENTIADRPMLQLVESLDHMLEVARHRAGGGSSSSGSSRGPDLQQLVLVLADGRFHEKESLRAAVRRLLEKSGVCVVFIALDAAAAPEQAPRTGGSASAAAAGGSSERGATSAASRAAAGQGSSLLEMQSVKFLGGVPVFERYLDTFPFPYYIVLRDIAALPRTLADVLRQWFELNSLGAP